MASVHILVAVGLLTVGGQATCTAKEPTVLHQATCGAGPAVSVPNAGCNPTCTAGYMVAGMPPGAATITCSNAALTPTTFTCDPVPCTNVLNSNGASGASGPACQCNTGYSAGTPSGTSQTVTWSGSPHPTSPGACVPHTCGVINSNMLPGPACACNSGYSADTATSSSQLVTWNGITAGHCIAHTCAVHNSNMAPGPACTCNPGYVANVPTNLSQAVSWNGLQPGTCVPVPTPPPTTPIPPPPASPQWPLWIPPLVAVPLAVVLGVYACSRKPKQPKKRAVKKPDPTPLVHTPPPVVTRVVTPPPLLTVPAPQPVRIISPPPQPVQPVLVQQPVTTVAQHAYVPLPTQASHVLTTNNYN